MTLGKIVVPVLGKSVVLYNSSSPMALSKSYTEIRRGPYGTNEPVLRAEIRRVRPFRACHNNCEKKKKHVLVLVIYIGGML